MPRALFVGHTYIDVTVLADGMPEGDAKLVADDYAVSFGGNAVTAAFACAKLGVPVELITTLADDWLGHMFSHMASTYGVRLRGGGGRKVKRSSLSFILPRGNRRAILRARDEDFREDFPRLDVSAFDALHLDGHQPDAALHYARAFRERGLLTSLDGGGVRANTSEVLRFTDVAVVAERLCEQMEMNEDAMLAWLREAGCEVGGVTRGEHGLYWYDEGGEVSRLPALPIPAERIRDTSGAGDVFHGAYIASRLLYPQARWVEHFKFARAAAAYKIQHVGNEAGLPSLTDIQELMAA